MQKYYAECWKCKKSPKCEIESEIRSLHGRANATGRKTGTVIELKMICEGFDPVKEYEEFLCLLGGETEQCSEVGGAISD